MRPRSPAERQPDINGGDLGGARVCRGAWRYAPLPQREAGSLAFCRHAVANPLHRSRIGAFNLPADLAPGQWRWLQANDIAQLQHKS